MIEMYGGQFVPPHNLRNADALHYLMGTIVGQAFGILQYNTLIQKAAAFPFHIITRHIFWDGTKRTGFHMAWEFLKSNGVLLLLDDSVLTFGVAVADNSADYQEVVNWLDAHLVK
jgi:death on curing protein